MIWQISYTITTTDNFTQFRYRNWCNRNKKNLNCDFVTSKFYKYLYSISVYLYSICSVYPCLHHIVVSVTLRYVCAVMIVIPRESPLSSQLTWTTGPRCSVQQPATKSNKMKSSQALNLQHNFAHFQHSLSMQITLNIT